MLIGGHVGQPDGRDRCRLLLWAIRAAFRMGALLTAQTVILGCPVSGAESGNKFIPKER